jgi:membrane protein DedA with SNARE-associated domain
MDIAGLLADLADWVQGLDLDGLIERYGYAAIFVVTFIEGESIQILGGWAAHEGILSFPLVFLAGFSGTLFGDQLYYWIGRRYGQALMRRYPWLAARAEPAFALIRRFDDWFILGFRFVYGVRNVAPFACGAAGIGILRYTALNTAAAAVWALSFAVMGYIFGKAIAAAIEEYGVRIVLPTVVGLGIAVWFGLRLRDRRRRRRLERL